MAGKILDRFSIVDDSSDATTVGELVTYVNDALIFAPSMLLVPASHWTAVDGDDEAFDVSFTDQKTTVSARVFVDAQGAMRSFSTNERFARDPAHHARITMTRW